MGSLASNLLLLRLPVGWSFERCVIGAAMRLLAIWPAPWAQRSPDASGIPAGRSGSANRHGVTGRAPTNALPLMVPRYQRNHFLPPALTTVLFLTIGLRWVGMPSNPST